jgi:hypothetical protein
MSTNRYAMLYTSSKAAMAIGYMPTSSNYYDELDQHGVKVIKIRRDGDSPALSPPMSPFKKSDYPIFIPFYLVWDRNSSNKCVNGFSRFVAQ